MGTNYYHEPDEAAVCAKCGAACTSCGAVEHIGKSSAGWTFSFHATDTEKSWADWRKRLEAGGVIRDEYGDTVALAKFAAMVDRKRQSPRHHAREYPQYGSYTDPEGHSFSPGEFS
jgi:hypothetical protein